jgi:RNA polymerase sigma-70 factor (ECF subfamily)
MGQSAQNQGNARPDASADAMDAEVERLLVSCAHGERQALERLYRLTSSRLLGVLLRILKRRELAEDALQDVYVRVWQRAKQFDGYRGRPMAWLVSIARYRAIDVVRSNRVLLPLDRPEDEPSITLVAEPETPAESNRTRAALERCLALLSDSQRRCVTLAFVNGLSHEEIATTVGSPLGTIKSWVRRGLLSLRACLES